MNRYRLVHTTEFIYDGAVSESYNEVRLRPIHDETQSCVSFRLTTTPGSRGTTYRDAYENWVHQFNVLSEHRSLKIEAESVVLTHEPSELFAKSVTLAEIDSGRDRLEEEYFDFLIATGYVPHLERTPANHSKQPSRRAIGTVVGFVQAASDLIHERFEYKKGATHVHSSIEDSLTVGAGVCQDFAHLLLGVVRMRGLPGRYVSGYLVPGGTSGSSKQEEVVGGQASHAWAEVFLPEQGWTPFDPTLGKPVGLRHVRLAYGRDYGDVAPVRGVYKGRAGQRLSVDVCVRPVLDDSGHERLSEATAGSPRPAIVAERPQQPAQQMEQQQQQ